MATSVSEVSLTKVACQHRGLVVELVGTAGVGKSTLHRALLKRKLSRIIKGNPPLVWALSSALFYIDNLIDLIPTFARMSRNGFRQINRRELAFMAILNGWHKILQSKVDQTDNIIVIDQGPISVIAYLNVWGPGSLFITNMQEWWNKVYAGWKKTIDMVIILDAADETIMQRINTRPQNHHLKGKDEQVVKFWLAKYRSLYETIINQMLSDNEHPIQLVRINSGLHSVDEIVEMVLEAFNSVEFEANQ